MYHWQTRPSAQRLPSLGGVAGRGSLHFCIQYREERLFSYRHGFHAGNHADVLKHCVLVSVFEYLRQKDGGIVFVDTHAGAGLYDLRGQWANKRGEYLQGIGRIYEQTDAPELVEPYLRLIREMNDSELVLYPGSPWVALELARSQDRLRFFELLGAEAEVLAHNLSQQKRLLPRAIKLEQRDGFAALKSVLPPPSRRALVLIDPAYENKQDYRAVVETLKDAVNRFATGCYMLWYPRVNRMHVEQMQRQVKKIPNTKWLQVELVVSKAPQDQHGLFGSGLLIINPPYGLSTQLKKGLPWLLDKLRVDRHAHWSVSESKA